MFDIADRLEILNMLGEYSHLYDEGRFDDWLNLFVVDATFEFVGAMQAMFSGTSEIINIPSMYREALARGEQGRHLLTNVTVLEQTASTASVAALALLIGTDRDGQPTYNAPGRYTGALARTGDGWRIARWQLHLDRPVG